MRRDHSIGKTYVLIVIVVLALVSILLCIYKYFGLLGSDSDQVDESTREKDIAVLIVSKPIISHNTSLSEQSSSPTQSDDDSAPQHPSSSLLQNNHDEEEGKNQEEENERTCSICLDIFQVGDSVSWAKYQDSCRHVYHTRCISSWLKKSYECPCCRENFNQIRPVGRRKKKSVPGDIESTVKWRTNAEYSIINGLHAAT